MTPYLFLTQTPTGFQPFALTFSEAACNLLVVLFRSAGAVGACIVYVPGVAS